VETLFRSPRITSGRDVVNALLIVEARRAAIYAIRVAAVCRRSHYGRIGLQIISWPRRSFSELPLLGCRTIKPATNPPCFEDIPQDQLAVPNGLRLLRPFSLQLSLLLIIRALAGVYPDSYSNGSRNARQPIRGQSLPPTGECQFMAVSRAGEPPEWQINLAPAHTQEVADAAYASS
jgi:hypothetical protein